MPDDKPNIAPLEDAIRRLDEGLAEFNREPGHELARDGLIQRFEFTYESACKTLARYLEFASPSAARVRTMSFPDLIRSANEHNLLRGDWADWKVFRALRDKTSHTYDKANALEVVGEIPRFLDEVIHLCTQLKENLSRENPE